MKKCVGGKEGFTLLELLVIVAGLGILAAATFPFFVGAMQRVRANGAAEVLAAAIRDARMRAIATGWQYRVRAFDSGGAVANAFRIEGMDPTNGGAWPAATTTSPPVFFGVNQVYEAYTDLDGEFGGAQIQIPGGGPDFLVSFDGRGQWAVPCVPVNCRVQVTTQGRQALLTVSAAGAVSIGK